MNETEFIAALRHLPLHEGARGLADDVAVLSLGDHTLVITHDMLVEGRHFLKGQDMADVAWKLVATNLSDLAAKGAEPLGVVLGYMLSAGDDAFVEGLDDVLSHYGVPLLGGDTVAGAPDGKGGQAMGLTAIGKAAHTPVPARAGARIGDAIFVTGVLGKAMLGFEALRDGTGADATAYSRPMARLAEGFDLAPLATAMMDISDGLLLDAFRMAEASEASFAIQGADVPVADEARRDDCLRWGDDYELLFTLPEGTFPPVQATRIGAVEARGFAPLFLDGEPIINSDGLGYMHK
ncbi:thiamine-monophosphate kinase [Aurantiacibacter atlanticus]|uniref:Thiamine-monophosphate kinase n=1 Tax=Aurantiacibacter atlanticus TaxID=1648404 RepID=A0A0H4VHV3_9SPHN|nr:thiamine-phosphate kinase [Aurantiacibacter atlanticus]AKQ42481.1 thiamine-monophosphate kinase [Aurantiacibacter atlanticus]MDF1834124.1 thiamine-phosphate kinase [Alteraurantiacibacter sp. bin_em_oilr2.035]